MPLLLVLLLVASVLDMPWPPAAVPYGTAGEAGEWVAAPFPPELTVAGTATMVGLSVLTSLAVSLRTARVIRLHPERRNKAVRFYGRWRQVAFYLNLGITAVALFALGWGYWVRTTFSGPPHGLLPFAELLVPGPYLLTLALNWFVYWPAERALYHASHPDRPFWSLAGFWVNNARQFFFPVFLVVLLNVSHQTFTRYNRDLAEHWGYQLGLASSGLILAVFLPLLVRPLLGLKRLPEGPTRDRLEATARRLGVRFSDLLLWPTRGMMANAMVIGVVPWARYVIFTDRLLDGLEPDELDAVFGHEAGHARYGHLPFYMVFLMLTGTAASGLVLLIGAALGEHTHAVTLPASFRPFVALPPLACVGLYLFAVFGWLSRVCERQADIFGARAGSCGNPACTGHDADTAFVERGRGLCPTGVRAMVRSLEKVMLLNGWDTTSGRGNLFQRAFGWVRAWQHGPMGVRVDYLLGLTEHPQKADRHDRRAFWVRAGIAGVLVAITIAGAVVGGHELLKWL
jgi:Zn-dependent protease with chaperone function